MEQKKTTFQAGAVGSYQVVIVDDIISVWCGPNRITLRSVDGLGTFITKAKDFTLGWARLEGEDKVLYLYDTGDDSFGYALNLSAEWCSEWGYAPFRT
ncbi:hypothetical protein BH23CHL2_BH23CHL2_19650 [soil metagenome]